MGKQKWRRACYAALLKAGYTEPQLYFERNRGEYTSYWGCEAKRAEVVMNKKTGTVSIFELYFAA